MSDTSSENMKQGKGITQGFRITGLGAEGDKDHPGDDTNKPKVGRPPKKADSPFKVVGRTAEEEGKTD